MLQDFDVEPEFEFFSSFSESDSEVGADSHIPENVILSHTSIGSKKVELTNNQRKRMVEKLLLLGDGNTLPKGAMSEVAAEFNVHRTTVWRIWSAAKVQVSSGTVVDVQSKKKGKVGRKPKVFDMDSLKDVPIQQRTTIRSLSTVLGISHSAVYRLLRSGQLRAHTNSVKPKLNHTHMRRRLIHIMTQVITREVNTIPTFSGMYNVIHIDEKWFYMSQKTQKFYLFPWEEEPYRSCQNKNFIGKVMFLAAVARPHISNLGEVLWDGKIGIFPFTEVVYAQRRSCNREAGTPETKSLQCVTQQVIRSKLINSVLPAIREHWPPNACKDIWIQQDNARPHVGVNDQEFMEAASLFGFNIRLTCQPAQSPDLNVLDLGFFRAIQSIQYKAFPKSVDELVAAVQDAFYSYEPKLLNYTWLHLQYIMLEILKVKGGNNYKNPHNAKKKLDSLGLLPTQVEIPEELIEETHNFLMEGQVLVPAA
ncbi:unnamed protein product [Cuscuta epithymum]|uniref:DUF7769 domain-containing protein n=1 Tax=Cuscuta epithymum TaxID=186058 RepID=A0AAV0DBR6_9ASTE|nr:unnamed protein product [Cuscuta epithymum]